MLKKAFAVVAFALLAVVGAPAAANAAGYVPSGNVTVSGTATPGGTVTVNFAAGSYLPGEQVSVSVNGATSVTLSVVKAALTTFTKPASSTGAFSVNVTLPTDATGTYTLTATGLTSGNVGTASITTVPASLANTGGGASLANTGGGAALANTGATLPMLMIWIGAGALVLGGAIVGTLAFVRRQRRNA
ncbi:hypothetical protein SPF06_19855 [Sinomonas sp. JGH33]|uniref:Sortase n=1 Tax=Sinomonas terricola TaxID=3110330 RepID=A0ABU5TBC2_9MICC|nr:hypothetical protein [Sinomonas sp. JGH33]MEA5456984.1 hypothetical protein [Sinomonas sp. JGH33]